MVNVAASVRLALVVSSLLFTTANAGALKVGAAKIDITPSDLTNLNPFGGGSFTAVHDSIYARALVFGDGTAAAAIVSLDVPEVGDMT